MYPKFHDTAPVRKTDTVQQKVVIPVADISNMLRLECSLYALMLLGYILRKRGFLKAESESFLSKLALDIILPCSIIKSFAVTVNMDLLRQFLAVFLGGTAAMLMQVLLGPVAFRFMPKEQGKVMKYALINANNAFLGYPIIEGLYGTVGLTQSSFYMIPVRFSIWTVGLTLFAGQGLKGKAIVKKCMLHPAMIGMYIGVFFMVTQLPIPGALYDSIKMMAACLSPISMLLIGSILTRVSLKKVFAWKQLYFCFVRLILMPTLMLGLFTLFGAGGLARNVSVLMVAMPGASITAVLASQYGSDEETAGILVTLSTLLSTLTIPMWAFILSVMP